MHPNAPALGAVTVRISSIILTNAPLFVLWYCIFQLYTLPLILVLTWRLKDSESKRNTLNLKSEGRKWRKEALQSNWLRSKQHLLVLKDSEEIRSHLQGQTL